MSKEILLGHVAVDSGQLMICDPCYIDSEWVNSEKVTDSNEEERFSYEACAKATLSSEGYGQLKFKRGHTGVGLAFGTAYGDGMYNVYGTYDNDGVIQSVTIKF